MLLGKGYCCYSVLRSVRLLWPHELKQARLPYPSPSPVNEFAQTHWVGDAIQPSRPLSSLSPPALNFFPASGSFPMTRLFPSGGESTGASASAAVLSMNIQGWFSLGLTGLTSLQSKGLSIMENKCMVTKGDSRWWGEMSWEFGINIYLLPSIRQVNRALPGSPVVRMPRFHCTWHRLN